VPRPKGLWATLESSGRNNRRESHVRRTPEACLVPPTGIVEPAATHLETPLLADRCSRTGGAERSHSQGVKENAYVSEVHSY
jgi:hypothetical protein